jgi:8-oxo-(d)GTP phosphatase
MPDWGAMRLLLARHADAGHRQGSNPDDRLRPLSPLGRRQAELLAERLGPMAPARVLTSPYRRCLQTVEPLCRDLGLTVEETDALAEGHPEAALALCRSLDVSAPDTVVVCSHGDVIGAILVAAREHDGVDLGPAPQLQKGSVWILQRRADAFSEAAYLPPPDEDVAGARA